MRSLYEVGRNGMPPALGSVCASHSLSGSAKWVYLNLQERSGMASELQIEASCKMTGLWFGPARKLCGVIMRNVRRMLLGRTRLRCSVRGCALCRPQLPQHPLQPHAPTAAQRRMANYTADRRLLCFPPKRGRRTHECADSPGTVCCWSYEGRSISKSCHWRLCDVLSSSIDV